MQRWDARRQSRYLTGAAPRTGSPCLFSKGLTSGVFQFESPGMRDILRRYQPSRVEDLCALSVVPGSLLQLFITFFMLFIMRLVLRKVWLVPWRTW